MVLWKWKYVWNSCLKIISFLVLKPSVFRPTCLFQLESYTAKKEISSSFQKCIGLYTLYEISQRNLTFKWHNTIDVNDDINDVTCLLHPIDVMTSDWWIQPETIAWSRHSSCSSDLHAFFKNVWLAQKMPLLVKSLFNFFGFKIKADSRLLRNFLRKPHVDSFFERKGVSPQDFVI